MILDSIQNSALYPLGPLREKAFDFLRTAAPGLEPGRCVIDSDDLFANIDAYETKPRAAARPEAHRTYVDIQVLLSGTECLEVFPRSGLTVSEPYCPEKDVEFYELPERAPVRVTLTPGQFIAFFPDDAHMPCLTVGDRPEPVKKIVFKLRADLLNQR